MKTSFKTVLFAYNFPHRKTIDFIEKIYKLGFSISLILAADFIKIKKPKSIFDHSKNALQPKLHLPKKIAEKYDIPFYNVMHNSLEAQRLIQEFEINFGIISGSRILKKEIISLVKYGILNFHPGILPLVRGLDSILWSIYRLHPIGVTAHLINEHIDSGLLVQKKTIQINNNDDLKSLYEKNYQLQLDLIPISLNLIFDNVDFYSFERLQSNLNYNTYMPYNLQLELQNRIINYINKFS